MSICEALKYLYTNKLTSVYDGNISYKPKRQNHFLITPAGIRKHKVTSNHLVNVKIKGTELEIEEGKTPSRELHLHKNILLDADKDIYVVHCHPPNILSYITDDIELLTLKEKFPEIPFKIGLNVDYFPAGSQNLALSTYENLQNNDIVALSKHGVVCVSEDLQYALDIIETLDFYAGVSVNSRK